MKTILEFPTLAPVVGAVFAALIFIGFGWNLDKQKSRFKTRFFYCAFVSIVGSIGVPFFDRTNFF
jgi:hypothetical protein